MMHRQRTWNSAAGVAFAASLVMSAASFAPAQSLTSADGSSIAALTVSEASTLDELVGASDFTEGHADVLRLWIAFFDRDPDVGGAQFWLGEFDVGVGVGAIADSFAVSDEFVETYGDLDDEAFVDTIYLNVLDRGADAAGAAFWLAALDGGLSRGGMVQQFSTSPEFVEANPFGSVDDDPDTSVDPDPSVASTYLGSYTLDDAEFGTQVTVVVDGSTRTIQSNALPDHETGEFPTVGNPNTISAQDLTYEYTTEPSFKPALPTMHRASEGSFHPLQDQMMPMAVRVAAGSATMPV